jgi:hypothetical protein
MRVTIEEGMAETIWYWLRPMMSVRKIDAQTEEKIDNSIGERTGEKTGRWTGAKTVERIGNSIGGKTEERTTDQT